MYEPVEPVHFTSHPVSLSVFSERYGNNLPQVIAANEPSDCEDLLQAGQEFEVYFKKETPVVSMEMAGRQYSVPLNSAFKFSVLYNPNNYNLSAARRGHYFITVADLIKADPIPSVVYVGKACTGEGGVTIPRGQILAIQEIINAKMIKCLTLDDNTPRKIFINEKREGYFSTRESLLLFPLSELLKNIKQPFTTSIYENKDKILHPSFQDKCATVNGKQSTLPSFIVSCITTEGISKVAELCSSLSSRFCVCSKSDHELYQIMKKADSLSRTLSPHQVTAMIHNDSSTKDTLQADLLLPSNNSSWLKEIKFTRSRVYEPLNLLVDKRKSNPAKLPSPKVQSTSSCIPASLRPQSSITGLLTRNTSKQLAQPRQDLIPDERDTPDCVNDEPDMTIQDNAAYGVLSLDKRSESMDENGKYNDSGCIQ